MVDPVKIKEIYRLWYEFLRRSNRYKRFCDLMWSRQQGLEVDLDEFSINPESPDNKGLCWLIYSNQWGDIHRFDFIDFWKDHGERLITEWSNTPHPLDAMLSTVQDTLTSQLTDNTLKLLLKQAQIIRYRSKLIREIAAAIVLKIEQTGGRREFRYTLNVSANDRKHAKPETMLLDLDSFDAHKKGHSVGMTNTQIASQMKISVRRMLKHNERAVQRIKQVQQGFFPNSAPR